ncbi:electron transfer flavoprotein subunit alpha/FixB family protein [Propionivibrio sp.]|uniref:electron transfer flavoprotein subunit alpha/FixB family protein n=1 Tax=Propionivibrio sp. TaxID=2212460 RepID=UPI0039E36362
MKVLILGEHDGRQLKVGTRQAVTAASQLGEAADLLLVGHQLDGVAAAARALRGVSRVLVADAPHLASLLAEDVAALLVSLAGGYGAIVAPHATFARNALPRAAAMLDVAMLSDVLEILGDNTYLRPIYAGNLVATVQSRDPIQVLTVRGSRFALAEEGGQAEIVALAAGPAFPGSRRIGARHGAGGGPELGSARVVVSGGRCLGSAERFDEVLSPLAEALGAALGATRAAVDAGYAPNEMQVGQTGTIVAPDLYFAIGVSGAVQHTAGMKDSKIVVAINKDPEAPIFEVADYGLVADLFDAVPALTTALNAALNEENAQG